MAGDTGVLSADEALFLLDYDFTSYYLVTERALRADGGTWSFTDYRVGGDGPPGRMQIVLVRASPACAASLIEVAPNLDGDRVLRSLPATCADQVADRTTVELVK